jgi:hypothetical protein
MPYGVLRGYASMTNDIERAMQTTTEPQALSLPDFDGSTLNELLAGNQELLSHGNAWAFPQGPNRTLYNGTLEHVPFVVAGAGKWGTKPASSINTKDEAGAITGSRVIPAQECYALPVRLVSVREDGGVSVGDEQQAILTGAYLLNQLRSLLESGSTSMLYGHYVWTVRRNPQHTTMGGSAPYMLALYDPSRDNTEDIPF